MSQTLRYSVVFSATLLATLALTPFAAALARRLDIQDRPAPNKFHSRPTPYLGGLAVTVALVGVSALTTGWRTELLVVVAGAVAMLALGLVDDVRTVRPSTKLIVQTGAALALWIAGIRGGPFGGAADLPFTILWVVGVTNALNLLDNMDGLLSGVAAVSAFAFFVIAATRGEYLVGSLALAVAAASLGFLRYNFPPARIFLGDAGSLVLGFLLAAIGLKLDLVGPTGLVRSVVPVLILGVPLFDTALVITARIREGRRVFVGSTDHSSHRLVAAGLSPSRVALVAYSTQAALAALAVWLVGASGTAVVATTIGVGTVGVAVIRAALARSSAPRRAREGSRAGAPRLAGLR